MAKQEPAGMAPRDTDGNGRHRREQTRRAAAAGREAAFQGIDTLRRWFREPRARRVYAVTVGRSRDEVQRGEIQPLARLREITDVELRDAPGDRGTEIVARRRGQGMPTGAEVRRLLREVEQVAETGHVVRLTPQPSARGPVSGPAAEAVDRVLSGGGQR